MSRINIFLLDNENNTKEEINMIKPKSYQEFLDKLNKKIPENYELFIIGKNYEEIKINNEEIYKTIEDIIFIREIDKNILEQSLFQKNYNILSESKQIVLDEKYNCILCSMIIKNEYPYFCYICQKIFHENCLNNWDKKCKEEEKNLSCPNCRNELPKEKWKKKLDYEDNRKDNANLMNQITKCKLNNKLKDNISIIKDKKIKELKDINIKQYDLIQKYEKYIQKTIDIFKSILDKINSLHHLLNLQSNDMLNNLIVSYPLNIHNLEINNIGNIINEELEQFKNIVSKNEKNKQLQNNENNFVEFYFKYKDKINLWSIIINYIPQINNNNHIQINNLIESLFNKDIEYINMTEKFNYIKSDKKTIKFIYNNKKRYLMNIPTIFSNEEIYSIASRYLSFYPHIYILIHNNKIMKKEEATIKEIPNNDIIWVIENKIYPDDSYYISLKHKYQNTEIINVFMDFPDINDRVVYQISREATIQELIKAITEERGLTLTQCQLYCIPELNPNDNRKIKEIFRCGIIKISCTIKTNVLSSFPHLGKNIIAFNKKTGIKIEIGTLDPISLLFDGLKKKVKKIIIGKIEFSPETENYLAFYGIDKDFEFTFLE